MVAAGEFRGTANLTDLRESSTPGARARLRPGFHSGPNYGILKMPFDRSAKPGRDPFLPSLARRQLSQENP